MKSCLIAVVLAGSGLFAAGRATAAESSEKGTLPTPRAWLGIRLEKPDRSVAVHVPSLPQGIGFVVIATDDDGPARAAGVREFDLLWKLGDQMLVNEAQLAALLRLSKPGEEVELSAFREGKPLVVKLKLGEAPEKRHGFSAKLADAAIFPEDCEGPRRIVNIAEKSASFSSDDGSAVVRREGGGYRVTIKGANDEPVFEGALASRDEIGRVPESWKRRVEVLCRTLDQAIDGGGDRPRSDVRPRVVAPVLSKP